MTTPDGGPKCEQQGCDRQANTRVFWPGRPPMLTCLPHAAKAQALGDAMSCYIGIEEYHPEEPELVGVVLKAK